MIQIQDVLRAGHIKRWNIVNTTRPQTLAEHLFNVAMISHTIASQLDLTDHQMAMVLSWALAHDVPEVVCGDTPTPTKKRIEANGFDMEVIYCDIDPTYSDIKEYVDTDKIVHDIVKVADLLESYYFLNENGAGRHADQVCANIATKLHMFMQELPDDLKTAAYKVYEKMVFGGFYE